MTKLEWIDAFELGVPEIDGEHRIMLELMKAVQSAAAAGNRRSSERYLYRLLAYTAGHFAREEVLLAAWKYPAVKEHASYHAELQDGAEVLRQGCIELDTPERFEKCCTALLAYLVDDVMRGDLQLKSFFDSSGVSLQPS